MKTYYKKPYPTARDIIQDKEYDYISYRIYKDGEKEYRNAFKTSKHGSFVPLAYKGWSPWTEICPEDARIICSEEWSTPEIKKGLTIVALYDEEDLPKDDWPFFAHYETKMDTYAEILCHNGDTFIGDIRDLVLSINDDKLGAAILLTPREKDSLHDIGNFIIPMSFIKTIKRKEGVFVP